jgi:hypothetical protein
MAPQGHSAAQRPHPLAVVVIDHVPARAELDDGVVGAGAVAVVAAEAVAAGQAAAGLEQRRQCVQAAGDLVERGGAAGGLQRRPDHERGVGVVPGVEPVELRQTGAGQRGTGRRGGHGAAQPGVDRPGGLLAVTDGDGYRALSRDMSPPAKMPGCPVIRSGPTSTVPPENVTPGTPSSTARSASWPRASTRQSADRSSNSPVG